MTDDELSEFIMDQFMKYDTDGSGYLDRKEFKALLTGTEMGLSKKDARRLLSEADENDDGVLEYTEFVPIMTEIVSNMRAKEVAREMKEEEEDDAREQVQYHLLHGMPREELEEMMERIFSDADAERERDSGQEGVLEVSALRGARADAERDQPAVERRGRGRRRFGVVL